MSAISAKYQWKLNVIGVKIAFYKVTKMIESICYATHRGYKQRSYGYSKNISMDLVMNNGNGGVKSYLLFVMFKNELCFTNITVTANL